MNKRDYFLRRINYDPSKYPFGAEELLLEDEMNKQEKMPIEAKIDNRHEDNKDNEEITDRVFPFSAEELLMKQEDEGLIH